MHHSFNILVFFLAFSQTILAENSIDFDASDGNTLKNTVYRLKESHYKKIYLNDKFSSELLDALIERLDPSRQYFLQSDIQHFERYRHQLDDFSVSGDLSAAADILGRYQERVTSRLEQEIQQLPASLAALDFTLDERYQSKGPETWPASTGEQDELWRKHIKAMALDLKIAGKDMAAIEDILGKRLRNQLSRLNRINADDYFDIYINALTDQFDPHTAYLSPSRSEQFNISMSLSLEGIGATLQLSNEYTRVVSLVPGGPADRQGELQPADRIVGVGQGNEDIVDVIGWRLDDVVALIRGPKGSTVQLQVIPANASSDTERKTIRIIRDKVKLEDQAASGHLIDLEHNSKNTKLGVIKLPAFYADYEGRNRGDANYRSTTRDVKQLITALEQDGAEGLIIDLRNNGGGDLHEVIDLTGLFIDSGPVVQIRNSDEYVLREGKSSLFRKNDFVYKGPVVVLVNRLSASASEIFAGALQDYGRAVIVGSRTFGKGTVQTLTSLGDGQLKFTVSKFYRISGGSTQHRGVEPDITLPSMYDESEVGESSYDTALPWDSIHGVRHMVYFPINQILPALEKRHTARTANDPDFNFVKESARLIAEANRDVIELQIDKRKAQLDKWRTATLALENTRRKAKGLPEYQPEVFETISEDEPPPPEPRQTEAQKSAALYSDMYLIESGRVLVDFMEALQAQGFYQEGSRSVTHSSATVGWMPRVASSADLVAPQAIAIATP
ncbi:MAG: hypothetical protein EP312_08040 [Gammaproteobacteria bacterium]|nr:MAG: hypothetical protein EP312_08040 [Gammaproteobacteria bacterium]